MTNTPNELLAQLNTELKKQGLLELALIAPTDCIPQKKNARYFKPDVFQQLVKNIKREKHLESVPLVQRHREKEGKYHIISGHHRIEAAVEAKLKTILVMVAKDDLTNDEIVSKQLSHNSLVGVDDQVVLKELFESIKDIEMKIATGLQDEINKIQYDSLNFMIGSWKSFHVLFVPEDEKRFDEVLQDVAENAGLLPETSAEVTSLAYYKKFADNLQTIKATCKIKNNGAAFMYMVELAAIELKKLKAAKEEDIKETRAASTSKRKKIDAE